MCGAFWMLFTMALRYIIYMYFREKKNKRLLEGGKEKESAPKSKSIENSTQDASPSEQETNKSHVLKPLNSKYHVKM